MRYKFQGFKLLRECRLVLLLWLSQKMLLFIWIGAVSGVLAAYPLHRDPLKLADETNYTISDLRVSASLADGRSDFVGHFGLSEANPRDMVASCRVDMGDSNSATERFVGIARIHSHHS